jgi:Recombination endonuclease VII
MPDLYPGKTCPDCGVLKPAEEFGGNKQMADGLARYCKECFRRRSKASYRKRMAEQGRQVRERPDVPAHAKYCPKCGEVKDLSCFGLNRAEKSGRAAYCKPCHNAAMAAIKAKKHGSVRGYHLERRYGITEQQVAELASGQGAYCMICLRRRSLHVDHDHGSGEVRGLLCFPCNGGLGQFKHDPTVMRAAVDYLEGRLGAPFQPVFGDRRKNRRSKRGSRRHYRLTGRYGIGEDDVRRLVERQGGLCLICRNARATVVDHDHVTLVVRGILCGDCNTGMGQLRDDPWVLRRAVEYLTGGLSGLRRGPDGRLEVTIVRPRGAGAVVDPGWDIGQIGGHDLAVLHAFACDGREELGEFDLAEPHPRRHDPFDPSLDLRASPLRAPDPGEPPDPAEYAFS